MSSFFDLDKEKDSLAYALTDLECFADASNQLASDFFEDTRHQRIFEAAKYYYQQYGGCLDKNGLQALLVQNETPAEKQIVYLSILEEVRAKHVTKDQFKVAVSVLEDMRFKRGLYDMINKAAANLQRGQIDKGAVCNDIVASVLALQAPSQAVSRAMSWKEDLLLRQEAYKDRQAHPEKYRGIPYGIRRIDELTGGMMGGEFCVFFGRPAAGKSSMLHNVSYHNALLGSNVLAITIEMPKEQIGRRLDSRHLQISAKGLRNAALLVEEEKKFLAMQESIKLLKGDVFIEDMPSGCSVGQILPVLRRHRLKHKIDLVVIDYMNLMQPSRWSNSKTERTGDVARELKMLARLENIPVLTAAKANRKANEAKEDEVDTEHLSWSDDIGYDADQIMFLRKDKKISAIADEVECIMIKFRDGANERVVLGVDFDRSFMGDMDQLLQSMSGRVAGGPTL